MSSTPTQSQHCSATPISFFVQCSDYISAILFVIPNAYFHWIFVKHWRIPRGSFIKWAEFSLSTQSLRVSLRCHNRLSYQSMSSNCTQSQLYITTTTSYLIQCSNYISAKEFAIHNVYFNWTFSQEITWTNYELLLINRVFTTEGLIEVARDIFPDLSLTIEFRSGALTREN